MKYLNTIYENNINIEDYIEKNELVWNNTNIKNGYKITNKGINVYRN